MWVLGRNCQRQPPLAQIYKWVKTEQMCKVRREMAMGQVPSTEEENPAGLRETGLWNTEIERLLWGTREQQLSRQMGVRTGSIPELGKGLWIPRKMRCQQLHESAQGWSRWASWTTEPWLKIGNQQSQGLQLNDHTRLSCLQRKGDCLIHLHNPAHTPAPTNIWLLE